MSSNSTTLRNTRPKGLSGLTIKWFAVTTMILDHIGYAIVYHLPGMSNNTSATYAIYMALRFIGRCAFPIYCFMLVEGIMHTRSYMKYALRILIFALLSEIPFDLAFYGRFFMREYQNVFLTLFIGVLMLWGFEYIRANGTSRIPDKALRILGLIIPTAYATRRIGSNLNSIFGLTLPKTIAYPLTAVLSFILIYGFINQTAKQHGTQTALMLCADLCLLAVCALTADKLHTDYSSAGIITIAIMYLYRNDYFKRIVSGCVVLAILSNPVELVAFTSVPLIRLYNGTRGRGSKLFFYIIYPLHLIILYLISVALGLRQAAVL